MGPVRHDAAVGRHPGVQWGLRGATDRCGRRRTLADRLPASDGGGGDRVGYKYPDGRRRVARAASAGHQLRFHRNVSACWDVEFEFVLAQGKRRLTKI